MMNITVPFILLESYELDGVWQFLNKTFQTIIIFVWYANKVDKLDILNIVILLKEFGRNDRQHLYIYDFSLPIVHYKQIGVKISLRGCMISLVFPVANCCSKFNLFQFSILVCKRCSLYLKHRKIRQEIQASFYRLLHYCFTLAQRTKIHKIFPFCANLALYINAEREKNFVRDEFCMKNISRHPNTT